MITNLKAKLDRLALQPLNQSRSSYDISLDIGGSVFTTDKGGFIIKKSKYPIGQSYGKYIIENVEKNFCRENKLLFFDTETSGLGAGAYAFLVGVAYYKDNDLVIEQIFMRDLDDESAVISYLAEKFSNTTVVSFNGKAFDVPLIHARGIINSVNTANFALKQIDLLHLSRRIWKRRLESCRLSSIEEHIIHFQRNNDINGSLIPDIYKNYLATGESDGIAQVMEHNEYDIVSLSVLLAKLLRIEASPEENLDNPEDMLSLGIYYFNSKQYDRSKKCLEPMVEGEANALCRYNSMKYLSLIYKRQKQSEKAAAIWKKMSTLLPYAHFPLVELSKYYEHTLKSNDCAIEYAKKVRDIAIKYKNKDLLLQTEHRISRLKNKLLKGIHNNGF